MGCWPSSVLIWIFRLITEPITIDIDFDYDCEAEVRIQDQKSTSEENEFIKLMIFSIVQGIFFNPEDCGSYVTCNSDNEGGIRVSWFDKYTKKLKSVDSLKYTCSDDNKSRMSLDGRKIWLQAAKVDCAPTLVFNDELKVCEYSSGPWMVSIKWWSKFSTIRMLKEKMVSSIVPGIFFTLFRLDSLKNRLTKSFYISLILDLWYQTYQIMRIYTHSLLYYEKLWNMTMRDSEIFQMDMFKVCDWPENVPDCALRSS